MKFAFFIFGLISVHTIATAEACGRSSSSVMPHPGEIARQVTVLSKDTRRIDLRMLADLVHDMKTPLWSITGTSEMLMEDLGSEADQEYQTHFSEILASGELLLTHISDILVKTKVASQGDSSESKDTGIDLAMLEKLTEPLKTILKTIQDKIDLLNSRAVSENRMETLGEPIDTINAGNHALLQLVENISDLASLQGGTLKVTPIQFSLNQMLSRILAVMQPLAVSSKLDLQIEVNGAVPDGLVGDPEILSRIIHNLIGNAVNFTTQGSIHLYVDGKYEGDDFVLNFRIVDTGKGMTSIKRVGLFQPESFMQSDADSNLKYKSTGLGLSIVKRLCDLIQGTVLVEKSVLGLGTTFLVTVKLPVWVVLNK